MCRMLAALAAAAFLVSAAVPSPADAQSGRKGERSERRGGESWHGPRFYTGEPRYGGRGNSGPRRECVRKRIRIPKEGGGYIWKERTDCY